MDWLAILTAPGVQISVAGGFGGISRWLFIIIMDRKMGFQQGMATILLGGILGFFVSPHMGNALASLPFMDGLATDSDKLPTFNAFALGILGVAVIGYAIDWANKRKEKLDGEPAVTPTSKPADGDAR